MDANQAEVVKALRTAGMSVLVLSAVGQGCPDLAVGWRGITVLVEVKDGAKVPSAQRLTADEVAFFDSWAGAAVIANSAMDAVMLVVEHARRCGVTV